MTAHAPKSSLAGLTLQQRALAFDTPAIPACAAIAAHDAMTWHRERDRIGCTGLCHRTRRTRRADARSDLRVGRRLAGAKAAQRLPDALLERGAGEVEGQVERASSPNSMAHTPRPVAATSTTPSEHGAVATRMVSPAPAARYAEGVMPSSAPRPS